MTSSRATWVTSTEHVDHLASQREQAASILRGDGALRALCGAPLLTAPLIVEPGPRCRACVVAGMPRPLTPAGASAPDLAPAGLHRAAS